ncbi:hypothetical protein I203_104812 [Kwoniella mangroviensis CBS 8507]|uniref:uncharacterized protein n=1 Tax=Kwoniella mangroviensis CBS 8507 TaxID=1296122 RepID=UPI00080D37B5|nr:uncharacterized protein I203_00246 [Kwoniella mangroviensis CBS 8507]OCF70114.1 hypothetical protein I203_00246 [Kwoniella mangroviensis CBS 8507]
MLLPITPPRRPTTLPPSQDPFDTPLSTTLQLPLDPPQSASTPHSTTITPSTTTATPNREVRTAYVAERSSADLINVLDLVTPDKDKDKMIGSGGIRSKTISPPLTPERSHFDNHNHTNNTSPVTMTTKTPPSHHSSPVGSGEPFISPPRPPRPAISPLDMEDDEIEQIAEQPHSLSAFRQSSPRDANKPKPGMDQSFWRWSNATSSVAQSEQNQQHVPAPPSTYTYASSISQPPEMDKSFLRMTRTTIFSDFSAPSTVPDIPDPSTLPIPFRRPSAPNGMTLLSAIPESAAVNNQDMNNIHQSPRGGQSDVEEENPKHDIERRSSAGTFGYKNPRSSIIGSVRSNSYENHRTNNHNHDPRVNPFYPSPPPSTSRSRPRPVSMSSAAPSEMTMSNAASASAYSGRALDDTALEARKALGVFTPPKAKIIHKHQESEAEIENYLKKASERNQRSIVPSDQPRASTPIKNGLQPPIELRDGEGDDEVVDLPKKLVRNGNKIERMLGEGAENARVVMEMDRRAIESVIEQRTVPSPGLPPPLRSHKPSASMPNPAGPLSLNNSSRPMAHNRSHTLAQNESLASPPLTSHANTHLRSASIDSLPSLHPSLSESINTLSGLLPASPTKPSKTDNKISPFPPTKVNVGRFTDIRARNDLTPEQRAILLRRTRKLEQMLGEALPEKQIEKLVIDPVNSSSTYLTKNSEDSWPKTPPSSSKVPEWARDDVIPHRAKDSSPEPHQNLNVVKSKGSLADKAKAALGLGSGAGGKDDLKVYVSRSLQESHTISRGNSFNDSHRTGVNRSSSDNHTPPDKNKHQSPASSPTTPATATTTTSSSWPTDERDEEEVIRKNRRQQLAKLHRLLGAPIPPELLNPNNPTSPSFNSTFNLPPPLGLGTNRSPSPSQQSYISFEDTPTPSKWSSRLKVPLNSSSFKKKANSSSVQLVADDQSFIDLSESRSKGGMSREEKSLARKRAAKLEQVLGDKPPPEYLHHHSTTSTPLHSPVPQPRAHLNRTPTPPAGTGNTARPQPAGSSADRGSAYDAYVASLEGLLYLVENDQSKLGEMMDTISMVSPPISPTRSQSHGVSGGHNHSKSLDSNGSRIKTPSPPSPLIDSPQSPKSFDRDHKYDYLDFDEDDPEEVGVDRESHQARRRRKGKLSQFFGENININIPHDELPPPRNHNTTFGSSKGTWTRRKETLDGMLVELWKNVQFEIGRGTIKVDQERKLEELLGLVRSKENGLGGGMGIGSGGRGRGRGRWEMI